MKSGFIGRCYCNTGPVEFSVKFTKEELKIYYNSIKNDSSIPDSFKLVIADALLGM